MRDKATNTVWHKALVTRECKERLSGHPGRVLWFTGLSGSGKSTLAHAVEVRLHAAGYRTFVMDGDNLRHGLCRDLGFSAADREENIRRAAECAKLFLEAGVVTLAAFISPFREDRARVRRMFNVGDFFEVHCAASLETCESRDVKGLYAKARAGEIKEFTGISSPYEPPENPELVIGTDCLSLDEAVILVAKLVTDVKWAKP